MTSILVLTFVATLGSTLADDDAAAKAGQDERASAEASSPSEQADGAAEVASPSEKSSAPEAAERPRLLVLDVRAGAKTDAKAAALVTSLLTTAMAKDEAFATFSGTDIRELLALEGEKAKLGCDEDASCLAEIAGAMGARFVVSARLDRLDQQVLLQTTLFDAERTEAIARSVTKGLTIDELVDGLDDLAAELLIVAKKAQSGEHAGSTVVSTSSGGSFPWLGVGGLGAAGSALAVGMLAGAVGLIAYLVFTAKDAPLGLREAGRWATFGGMGLAVVALILAGVAGGVAGAAFLLIE